MLRNDSLFALSKLADWRDKETHASSEGHVASLRFLVARAASSGAQIDINAADRFGNTPLDDAVQGKHFAAAAFLRLALAQAHGIA